MGFCKNLEANRHWKICKPFPQEPCPKRQRIQHLPPSSLSCISLQAFLPPLHQLPGWSKEQRWELAEHHCTNTAAQRGFRGETEPWKRDMSINLGILVLISLHCCASELDFPQGSSHPARCWCGSWAGCFGKGQ